MEVSEIVKATSKPGKALKAVRLERNWTLADVGERTGLPISTLSKIENGKMLLSYDKLARISKGLDIDIGVLFAGEAAGGPRVELVTGRRSVVRAGEGEPIETDVYSHLYPASDLLNKRFVPMIVEIRARSLGEFSEMIRHSGEEYTFVLEGAVELHTDVYAPLRLDAGDSVFFDSGMSHAYLAASTGVCRVLTICSGEESQVRALFGPRASQPEEAPARPRVVKAQRRTA